MFLAPADFVNLETLTADGVQYAQTTLNSTGKRLLLIGQSGVYQGAVDTCNRVGGEVLLIISEQENRETANFITANRDILGGEKIVWLRAKNPRDQRTDGSEWIDENSNEVIPYHHLVQNENQPAAFMRKFFVKKAINDLTNTFRGRQWRVWSLERNLRIEYRSTCYVRTSCCLNQWLNVSFI